MRCLNLKNNVIDRNDWDESDFGIEHFEKLTPKGDAELGIYADAFQFILENDDITNIAITGHYSSGKSSLIMSYKKNINQNFNFLKISLANTAKFEENTLRKNEKADPNVDNLCFQKENDEDVLREIEGKILNQIVYQIQPRHIPKIDTIKSRKSSGLSFFGMCVLVTIIIFYIMFLSFNSLLSEFVPQNDDYELSSFVNLLSGYYFLIFATIFALFSAVFLAWWGIRLQQNNKLFKKISIGKYGLEIFNKEKDSYFNKYLREIVYALENSEVDAVIF